MIYLGFLRQEEHMLEPPIILPNTVVDTSFPVSPRCPISLTLILSRAPPSGNLSLFNNHRTVRSTAKHGGAQVLGLELRPEDVDHQLCERSFLRSLLVCLGG